MEQYLFEEILKASNSNKFLKINVVIDRYRGFRKNGLLADSSFLMLKNIYN